MLTQSACVSGRTLETSHLCALKRGCRDGLCPWGQACACRTLGHGVRACREGLDCFHGAAFSSGHVKGCCQRALPRLHC